MSSLSTYIPYVVDITNIELHKHHKILVELLAENEHDDYARNLMNKGWKRGAIKNNNDRTDPLLIPFNDLTLEQKNKYIQNAEKTIKTMLKLGYRIVKIREKLSGHNDSETVIMNDNINDNKKAEGCNPLQLI